MKSELTSSNGVRLIPVTPGSFIIESPQNEVGHEFWEIEREVTLSHEFYLGATTVTQRQFELATGENPTDHPGTAEDAPVDSVRWQAATEFCAKLTEIDRDAGILSKDWEYRLPTETEWEYACRAGTSGATYGPLDSIAWHFGNSDLRTHPVCEKSPNPWGFYDMLGNVWEMCQDWFSVKRQQRACRGGSYFNTRKSCRAAATAAFAWQPLRSDRATSILRSRNTRPRAQNLRFSTRLTQRITLWRSRSWPTIPTNLKQSTLFHPLCTCASTKTGPRCLNCCWTTARIWSDASRITVRHR
jgi:formylglycine-generating enzyme required for sulfatase activity